MKSYDQCSARTEVPQDVSGLTPEWLTTTLYSSGLLKDGSVTSVETQPLGPGAGYMGKLLRLRLAYSDLHRDSPDSIIAKMSHENPEIRRNLHALGVYETEVNFYRKFSQEINLPIPICYYGDIDHQTGSSILLLEDLAHYKGVDFLTGCNLPESETVVEHLAKFHTHWWEDSRLLTTTFLTPLDYKTEDSQRDFQEWWSQFPEKLDSIVPGYQLPSAFIKFGYDFSGSLAHVFHKMTEKPVTFIHKDVHSNNLLFDSSNGERKVKFLDWQTAGYGRGVTDVGYFMISSTPISLRQQEERRLLQEYYRLISNNGITDYTFEQCWSDYQLAYFKNLFVIGVLVNVLDTSNPEGRQLLEALLPRVIAFSEDHDLKSYL